MSSTTNVPITLSRRVAAFALIVLVSVTIPMAIVYWSVITTFSGRPIGFPSHDFKLYQWSLLKDGDLWFGVYRDFAPPFQKWRLKRLDLKTGIEHETGLGVDGEICWPFWMDDELHLFGPVSVYRLANSKFEKIAPRPQYETGFGVMPFLNDGRLTTIVETDDGGHRLIHLVDGQWIDGREILMPDPDSIWSHDAQRDRWSLTTRNSENSVALMGPGRNLILKVIPHEQETHLFLTDSYTFLAYRNGFEYAEAHDDAASALAPANAAQEVSGWDPILIDDDSSINNIRCDMGCDQNGALLIDHNDISIGSTMIHRTRLIRRKGNGRWEKPVHFDGLNRSNSAALLANPCEDTSYVISMNQRWGSLEVHRIEGSTIRPAHIVLPGSVPEYLARWKRLLFSIAFAWVIHLVMLLVATVLRTCRTPPVEYSFGLERATLASVWRRGLALGIDAVLAATTLFLLARLTLQRVWWEPWTQDVLCESLIQHETYCGRLIDTGLTATNFAERSLLELLLPPFQNNQAFYGTCIVEALVLFSLRVAIQGRYGITPGKWLLGLRTFRTTLRPCGFARALVRDLLYWIDIPFFVTPLPAMISIMSTPDRQRLGDRVADTIVVNVRSVGVKK